jgi:transposase
MVQDQAPQHGSQWAAIRSIAEKVGCHRETLRNWVRDHERDTGQRPGPTTDDLARLKELERENRELRRANEILKKASVDSTGQRNTIVDITHGGGAWPRSDVRGSRRTSDSRSGRCGEPVTRSL